MYIFTTESSRDYIFKIFMKQKALNIDTCNWIRELNIEYLN
jgi:hypothetical protein